MGLLVASLIIVIAFIIFYVYSLYKWSIDETPSSRIQVIRILYIINTIFLLSSCYMHYNGIPYAPLQDNGLLLWIHNIITVPCFIVFFLRMFFVSNTYSIVLTIFYIILLKKTQFPQKETILFIILLLLSILGFVCLELEMNAIMHAWSGV